MDSEKWDDLDIVGLMVDTLLTVAVLAVFVSAEKVIWFHMVFLMLVVLAFRATRRALVWRAIPASLAVTVALFVANANGQVPTDELYELPILGSMIGAVHHTASRRARAAAELSESKKTIDQLHGASRRELQDQLILGQRLQVSNRINVAVVHDINNALSRMRIAAEMLDLHGSDRALVEATADEIIAYIDETALIARELLSTARMTNTLEPEVPESIRETLAAVTPLLRRLCRTDIVLELSYADLADRPCALPRLRIEQVLSNLIANAIDAIGSDAGMVRLVARTESGPRGDHAVIDITDTGAGMDAATLDRVFEPYFTTKEQGTGLGLFAVRELLASVGGTVHVFSEAGEGSTVRVSIPHERPADAPGTPRAGRQRALHVLLADDDHVYRSSMAGSLSAAGHRVTTAADGQAALDILTDDDGSIDIVVSDVGMPRLDGLELAAALDATVGGMPILLLTGEFLAPVMAADGTERRVLRKPVPVADLLTELQLAVADRSVQESGSNR